MLGASRIRRSGAADVTYFPTGDPRMRKAFFLALNALVI
jgi:hypothetical protein